jgi:hypothetical protein
VLPGSRSRLTTVIAVVALMALRGLAYGGPPYITDDPEPTDFRHFEIYFFQTGTSSRFGIDGATGIDFNYGAVPDLQLTAVLPVGFQTQSHGPTAVNLSNVELAAKYRLLHQTRIGLDAAIFPRLFLPAGSSTVGQRHPSLLVPIWLERDQGPWSTFGGGGYEFHRGGKSRDFFQLGWVITRKILPNLQIGAEIYHQSAEALDAKDSTGVDAGFIYDLDDHFHLMGTMGPGIQNANDANRYSWYTALLATF